MKKIVSKWLMGDVVKKQITDAPFNKVIEKLSETIKENSFTELVTHNLKEIYIKNDLKLNEDFEYSIVQICNPQKSYKVLNNLSFDVGVMMPKSIIVARENGKTTLRYMKLKPWMVGMMFPEIDLAPMSKNVMNVMQKIVTETITKAELE